MRHTIVSSSFYRRSAVVVAGIVGFSLVDPARAQGVSVQDFDWDSITPSEQLQWTTCYTTFQCSRFSVPLAYADPNGEKASIAIIRYPSRLNQDDGGYRGPILFNPGGPGVSGVEQLLSSAAAFQTIIGDDFDIVSFDPRGVGRTKPSLDIFSTRQESLLIQGRMRETLNTSSSSLGAYLSNAKVLNGLTEARAKTIAEHVSTSEVTKDMLGIITAYGREKLQYWGVSYGTALGATFAAMFPDKVERIILDGVTDAETYYLGTFDDALVDSNADLTLFYEDCVKAGPDLCPIYEPTIQQIEQRVNSVLERLKVESIAFVNATTGTQGVVTYDVVKDVFFRVLYAPYELGPAFASSFFALESGNPEPIWSASTAASITQLLQGSCDAEVNKIIVDAFNTAAIGCGDAQPVNDSLEDLQVYYAKLASQSAFADLWSARAACSAWKIQAKDKFEGPISANTSHPILFIGNTADPVTPLRSAHLMSGRFPGSVVLQQNSPGHTSQSATSACTADAIRNYFRDGTLPEPGTVCEVEGSIFGESTESSGLRVRQDSLVQASRLLRRSFRPKRSLMF